MASTRQGHPGRSLHCSSREQEGCGPFPASLSCHLSHPVPACTPHYCLNCRANPTPGVQLPSYCFSHQGHPVPASHTPLLPQPLWYPNPGAHTPSYCFSHRLFLFLEPTCSLLLPQPGGHFWDFPRKHPKCDPRTNTGTMVLQHTGPARERWGCTL